MNDRNWRFDIGDVLDRTDLRQLLSEVSPTAGRNDRWHCPAFDHDDHNPSVTVHQDRNGHERWKCWSNPDHKGDAIDLVHMTRGGTAAEAIEYLAERAGIRPNEPLPQKIRRTPPPEPAAAMRPEVGTYVKLCAGVLRGPQGAQARDWLTARGITPAAIRANQIGLDPGRAVMRRSRGMPYGAGPAVTFPAFTPSGELTYVKARYLDPDTIGRKYDNVAKTKAPNPRIGFAQRPDGAPDRSGVVLVTEGMPDAVIAAQVGFSAAGILGNTTPDRFMAARLDMAADGRPIAFAIDRDIAGDAGAAVLMDHLQVRGIEPVTIELPDGLDLNDWALEDPTFADTIARELVDAGVSSLSGNRRGTTVTDGSGELGLASLMAEFDPPAVSAATIDGEVVPLEELMARLDTPLGSAATPDGPGDGLDGGL